MTSDPFDFRCHRCGCPLEVDIRFCSAVCENAPTRWQTACAIGGAIRRGIRTWWAGELLADPDRTGPAGVPMSLLWHLDPAQLDARGRQVLADWLALHGIAGIPADPVEINRWPRGTRLTAGDVSTPLVFDPPDFPAAERYGEITRRDVASPSRKAYR